MSKINTVIEGVDTSYEVTINNFVDSRVPFNVKYVKGSVVITTKQIMLTYNEQECTVRVHILNSLRN